MLSVLGIKKKKQTIFFAIKKIMYALDRMHGKTIFVILYFQNKGYMHI